MLSIHMFKSFLFEIVIEFDFVPYQSCMKVLNNVGQLFTVNSNPCINVRNRIYHYYYYEVKTILEI